MGKTTLSGMRAAMSIDAKTARIHDLERRLAEAERLLGEVNPINEVVYQNISLQTKLNEAQRLLARIFDHFGPPQDEDPKHPDDPPCYCFMCELQREYTADRENADGRL